MTCNFDVASHFVLLLLSGGHPLAVVVLQGDAQVG